MLQSMIPKVGCVQLCRHLDGLHFFVSLKITSIKENELPYQIELLEKNIHVYIKLSYDFFLFLCILQ